MGDLPRVQGKWQGSGVLPHPQVSHSLFSYRPRPPPPSPHTTCLLPCLPTRPLGHHLPPLPRVPGADLRGWGTLGGFYQRAWVGSDWEQTAPQTLSACDWLRVSWAGLEEKRDAVVPPTLYKLVASLGVSAAGEGAWGRARSFALLPSASPQPPESACLSPPGAGSQPAQ